jgi:hypothetical protein
VGELPDMSVDELLEIARDGGPTADLTPLLRALCLEARGDWDQAHQIAQAESGRDAAWVHAYLHRKEGDVGNAAYWYRRAGRPEGGGGFDAEWRSIAGVLLKSTPRTK